MTSVSLNMDKPLFSKVLREKDRLRRLFLIIFALPLFLAAAGGDCAWAQDAKKKSASVPFLKTTVTPLTGTYLVLKAANVRLRPATKGRRVGRRGKGERVQVVGRAKGPWLAIRDGEGKDIGFIYQTSLMPVIDGTLDQPLIGDVKNPGQPDCTYEIHFEGKSPAEGQAFVFADYDIGWQCDLSGKSLRFHTPMFITEGPHRGISKQVHQITIDILDLTVSLEEVLSTHVLWNRSQGMVTFDSITAKQFARTPAQPALPATNLAGALHTAIKLATSSWNSRLWRAIATMSGPDDN